MSASPVPPDVVNVRLDAPAGTTSVKFAAVPLVALMPVTGTPLVSAVVPPPPPPPEHDTPTTANAAVTSAFLKAGSVAARSCAAVSTPHAPELKVLLGVQ